MKKRTKKKPSYKGPFQPNKNLEFQMVRKNMSTDTDGPTLNEVTPVDSTTDFSVINENINELLKERPVSTEYKCRKWLSEHVAEVVVGVLIAIIGLVAIDHSRDLARHDVEIDNISDDVLEQKSDIKELQNKTNALETDYRLLEQKVDFNEEKSQLRIPDKKKSK